MDTIVYMLIVSHNHNAVKAIETNEYFKIYNILLTYFL